MAFSLEDITASGDAGPARLVIYGPHGVGKTTLAASADKPLVLELEEGLDALEDLHGTPKIRHEKLQSFEDIMAVIELLYNNEHEHRHLVFDSLDWLEPLIWTHTCKTHGVANIEAFGFGKGYLHAQSYWRELLSGLRALRNDRGMGIVMTAHAEIKRFDAPDADPYDRYGIKLQTRAAALIEEWSDAILFCNYKTYTTEKEVGFNRKVARGVGTGQRIIYTEERPAFKAKNRFGLAPELPFTKGMMLDTIIREHIEPLKGAA
ncbi:MAG: ATP-binding protein [Gammaproteobacteria bacterium]